MKIATWNINGIKARLDNLLTWLKHDQPDIACLQEIKSIDALFPRSEIEALGYHVETCGQKSFNGVALISKTSPDEISRDLPGDDSDEQARFIEGVYSTANGVIRVANLYLPNGNPIDSDKYLYKLNWMHRLKSYVVERLAYEEPLILAGDFNVIPSPNDAKDPLAWINDALFLPQTRAAFREIVNLGLTDAVRATSDDILYTFWDYQAGAWQKNNGIRIDHMLLSPEAADKLKNAYIQKDLRSWERPSDHVPVWLELELS